MKKVNLGIALSLMSGVTVVHGATMPSALVQNQHAHQSKVLVMPRVQSSDLLLAQGGNGGSVNPTGNGGNAGSGSGSGGSSSSSGGTKK